MKITSLLSLRCDPWYVQLELDVKGVGSQLLLKQPWAKLHILVTSRDGAALQCLLLAHLGNQRFF